VRDFVQLATGYAKDVKAGRILACEYVRKACQAYLDGLRAQKKKDYPYKLDETKATRVCRFVELLPHVKGKWARDKEKIVLQPWQAFILVNVFGWVRKTDGLRRYRRVYVEVPRKNAKSTLTAALCNYMLCKDGEHGAEVYSGATSEKQAWEVFGPARLMAERSPELLDAFGATVGAQNVSIVATASKMEPIIGKPGDGASPSFSVTDEYHEHTDSSQYDTMTQGMAAREQPIAWVITTAGSNIAGPCYSLRKEAMDSLKGTVEYPELFSIIYTIDKDTDWTTEDALKMANPNWGVSVFPEIVLGEQQRAIKTPREQSAFKTKKLCVWVTAASPYFNAEKLAKQGDARLEEFAGAPVVLSFDLASKIDIAADMKLFAREIDKKRHYYAFGRFYLPAKRAELPGLEHYQGWIEQGHLIATPGNMTDFDYIEANIKADCEQYQLQKIGADPWNATQVITHLQQFVGEDKVVEVPQTTMHLSEGMKEIQAAIEDDRFHHDDNPCFLWMMGNVTAQADRNDNVFPRKESVERKIDGAVALIIGAACKGAFEESLASMYETEELLVV
jgi:phage terminase large subunit-like protein